MNNNQNNFNNSPQINNNLNNQNQVPLNVIPQKDPVGNQLDNSHQFDQDFVKVLENNDEVNNNINNQGSLPSGDTNNQGISQNTFINNPMNTVVNNPINDLNVQNNNNDFEDNPMFSLNLNKNKFINNNIENSNASLNSMNVDGEYNNMPKVDYSQDPRVQENMKQIKNNNTINIGSEGKIFIVIIAVLLLFVFVMPYIFDAIRNISQ